MKFEYNHLIIIQMKVSVGSQFSLLNGQPWFQIYNQKIKGMRVSLLVVMHTGESISLLVHTREEMGLLVARDSLTNTSLSLAC